MISRKTLLHVGVGCGIALFWGGVGCLSMQSQSSLDAASGGSNATTQPYVEAYVEYPGPQSKWAGPASFILHVTARDAGTAQIAVTPALSTAEDAPPARTDEPELLHRTPANAAGTTVAATPHRLTSEEAREQLAHLATALQGPQAPFHGCMSPVRVRLVRADGGIFERQGCRSELGWSRAVSEAVSSFVSASLHGATGGGPTHLPQPQVQPPGGAAPTSVQNQGASNSRGV